MIRLRGIELDGFRGYARREDLDFKGKSMLIYAPNGRGKTSIADAFEFVTSQNGSLQRFGERDRGLYTGRQPLRNSNRPTGPCSVSLRWVEDGGQQEGSRLVSIGGEPVPAALQPLIDKLRVPFIIHGHDLRGFVESTSASERYQETAKYLGAERLVRLQSDLRSLKTQLTQSDRTNEQRRAAQTTLHNALGEEINLSDRGALIAWMRDHLHGFGIEAPVKISLDDAAFVSLAARAAEEQVRQNTVDLKNAVAFIRDLVKDEADGASATAAMRRAQASATLLHTLRNENADGHRQAVLATAIAFLEGDGVERCPVCETPLVQTPYESREVLVEHLRKLEQDLRAITAAAEQHRIDSEASLRHRDMVAERIRTLRLVLHADDLDPIAIAWSGAYDDLERGDAAPLEAVRTDLKVKLADAEARVAAAEGAGPAVFQPLFTKARIIVEQFEKSRAIDATSAQFAIIQGEIDSVVALVNAAIHDFLKQNVALLGSETAAIYNCIQQGAPVDVAVNLRLTDADAADARGLEMTIHFPSVGVTKPQGYLSDSQMNTLALAFRIAIIRRFNSDVPFVVFDDVLTSHDAEFRDQASEMIIRELADLQLLVLTHDEMFARLMQDKARAFAAEANWQFRRIKTFEIATGPKFADHKTSTAELRTKLTAGERSNGLLRAWVEEWLEQLARQLGARFTMRRTSSPYDYGHFEMISAIQDVLKEKYGMDAIMAGIPDFAATLKQIEGAVVENAGTHHHENPFAQLDAMAERRLFERVERLQNYFKCNQPGCGGKLKYSDQQRRAACAKDACAHVFELRAAPW